MKILYYIKYLFFLLLIFLLGVQGTYELLLQAPSNIKPNIKVLSTGMTSAQKNMKVLDGMNDYWSKTNQGFIDDVIANSGDIRFISDPTNPTNIFKNGVSGERTVTGLEIQTLENLGYVWDASKFQYLKP
ncbi:hypothetical protein TFA04_30012 [Tenacibaculum maritimum]|uniref:hypothetical protein n=4 Tax=Tenacibaculum maritimum TaxID=107401 RepID=UPI0012E6957E|nr:hypothetical protein TFA04_30012 [Tenacibaculum maritimum]CAA0231327.1 hypothetical protein DPIF8902391_400007 [Tenacibaculum maritimum]CAA0252290.1 hypothetical protein TMP139_840002 [Tenacibaculum maritimum]